MLGTVMSPRPRGVLLKQRSKGCPTLCSAVLHRCLMMRAVGSSVVTAARREAPRPLAAKVGWCAPKWGLASRGRCTSPDGPSQSPAGPSLLPIDHVSLFISTTQGSRRAGPHPRCFSFSSPFRPRLQCAHLVRGVTRAIATDDSPRDDWPCLLSE